MSALGKIFRIGLNAITSKTPKGWANPANKGLKKLINGTQYASGHSIYFKPGLKHAIVRTGYKESLKKYHNLSVSAFSVPEHITETYNKVPRCLHQAMRELSDLMSRGVKV